MKKIARQCAVLLLRSGGRHRSWTPNQKRDWTTAFNALQRLAGKTIRANAGQLKAA